MRLSLTLIFLTFGHMAPAREVPVCLVNPDARALARIIHCEGIRSSHGPGHLLKDLLVLDRATFGERVTEPVLAPVGAHGQFTGSALLLSFHLHYREAGSASAAICNRSANKIMHADLPQVGESATSFLRAAEGTDITRVVTPDACPQVLALDNIRLGKNLEPS